MIAVLGRHGGTGRVGDRARTQQNQAVDALLIELILQSRKALAAHPGEIGQSRDRALRRSSLLLTSRRWPYSPRFGWP